MSEVRDTAFSDRWESHAAAVSWEKELQQTCWHSWAAFTVKHVRKHTLVMYMYISIIWSYNQSVTWPIVKRMRAPMYSLGIILRGAGHSECSLWTRTGPPSSSTDLPSVEDLASTNSKCQNMATYYRFIFILATQWPICLPRTAKGVQNEGHCRENNMLNCFNAALCH